MALSTNVRRQLSLLEGKYYGQKCRRHGRNGDCSKIVRRSKELVTKEHETESREAYKQIIGLLTEILTTTKTILEKQASSERKGLQYSYVSRERVEALSKYRCDSNNQFAPDLEKELHKNKPGEPLLRVCDRMETIANQLFSAPICQLSRGNACF
ncbi:hypothetical protein Y032_0378g281 [Ancylostoma ceylanicum]|uniref:Uncharacterized protein n=1 Tax=Ancylostoma ceylanicum TaxID=53326 RepID=A0A016RU37_9BILA|nr:hypothetical protein Y032_0378g281 [Ancylostoma ceylanicum]